MKKHKKILMLAMSLLLALLVTGCGKNSFKSISKEGVFSKVPVMADEKIAYTAVEAIGDENYQVWADSTTLEDYKAYLGVLEEKGFTKHVDNGEEGLDGYVYTAHYKKDNLLVVVTHYPKMERTTITAAENVSLSENLFFKEEYLADNISGAKTTITMKRIYDAGNSFIFQLKNGHFIVNDGGVQGETLYLLDYLEELAPNGEKPIIDAWIVSHTHTDHMGIFVELAEKPKHADRIRVNAIYYSAASEAAFEAKGSGDRVSALDFYVKTMTGLLKTSTEEKVPVYRMRAGERYYFNDILMDVVYSPDLLPFEEWKTWNASSTVLMYTIEGQKVLLTADTDYESQMVLLDIYDDEYFNVDVYQTPHHGGNVYNEVSRHITPKTVLIPSPRETRTSQSLLSRTMQNAYLSEKAEETLSWAAGSVVLTFPYEVGTYERLPKQEWIYHNDDLSQYLN